MFFRNLVRFDSVFWLCDVFFGNIVDNSIGCYDNLFILFERLVKYLCMNFYF